MHPALGHESYFLLGLVSSWHEVQPKVLLLPEECFFPLFLALH